MRVMEGTSLSRTVRVLCITAGVAAAAAAVPIVLRQMRVVNAIDPQFRVPMAYLPSSIGSRTLPLMRRGRLAPVDLGDVTLDVRTLPPADGLDGVEVRVYDPAGRTENSPALLYIHGGGFVVGEAAADDGSCAHLARRLGALVVSVEYRLAPEHPFPAAHNDCWRALRWLHENADELRVDPARVAVSGESAGGGLAAGLVQRAVDEGIPVAFQHLIYPMLDDRTVLRAEQEGGWSAIWTPRSNRFGWTSYLGHSPGLERAVPYAVPARRAALDGMPPTWIGVGSVDLFYEEDVAYAERLRASGVPCELHVVPGMFHAGQRFATEAPAAKAFERSSFDSLVRGLGVAVV
jgi:acetyl esterase/lipase